MRIGRYKVMWERSGFSWATPYVHVYTKIRFLPIWRWKKVWRGHARPYLDAIEMHPEPMKKWFKESITSYEQYVAAWKKEERDD